MIFIAIIITFVVGCDSGMKKEAEIWETYYQQGSYEDIPIYEGIRGEIAHMCEEKGFDNVCLAISVSRLETGNWTSQAYKHNNFGGISVKEVPLSYESREQGLEAYIDLLLWYQHKGWLDTIEEMASHYCPANKEQWANSVKEIMEEEKNY